MNATTISPRELKEFLSKHPSAHVIDVRTPAEFQEVHLPMARNIPLDRLSSTELPADDSPIIFVCKSGKRGEMACQKIQGRRVYNIDGGTMACVDSGLSVERGRAVMSLERQVRIAAGSLVLFGIALAYLHPAFLGLSAFVGAGLIFAGVTDTCGMGMILARMPWNQVSSKSSCTT
jgi:rhodanese-related sulfurtransferase